jgi:ABC-type phosphate transport system substrate-binding protein
MAVSSILSVRDANMKKFAAIVTCLAMVVVGIYWFQRGGAPRHAAATFAPAPVDRPLILTGSSTLAPVMTQMARLFESTRPGVHVLVAMGDLHAESPM